MEVFEDADPAHRILADSVVTIMSSNAVSTNAKGGSDTKGYLYGVATAGHCVEETGFCKDARFVFGFILDSQTRSPNIVAADDVYGYRRILYHEAKTKTSSSEVAAASQTAAPTVNADAKMPRTRRKCRMNS